MNTKKIIFSTDPSHRVCTSQLANTVSFLPIRDIDCARTADNLVYRRLGDE